MEESGVARRRSGGFFLRFLSWRGVRSLGFLVRSSHFATPSPSSQGVPSSHASERAVPYSGVLGDLTTYIHDDDKMTMMNDHDE